jgi:hypothetical protein
MTDFNSLFPNFLSQCSQLKTTLMPVAYLLLVAGNSASRLFRRELRERIAGSPFFETPRSL